MFEAAQVDRVIGGPRWVRAACAANAIRFDDDAPEVPAISLQQNERLLCLPGGDWDARPDVTATLIELDRRWFTPIADALDNHRVDDVRLFFAADDGSLAMHCAAAVSDRALDWRRWLGMSRKRPVPTLAMPLSTVISSRGCRPAARATISGVNPYPYSKRFGTMKSTIAPNARKPRMATAQAVAPSAS